MAKSNTATGRTNSGATGRRAATKTSAARSSTTRTARSSASREAARAEAAPKAPRSTRSASKREPRIPDAVMGAVRAALDRKAEDVVVLDLRQASGFTDFFVICTGANARQITAIADAVRETLKRDFDERPALAEGIDRSEWILLDYFNFVVHVFSRECRAFYGLERLWGNAERHEFSDDNLRPAAPS